MASVPEVAAGESRARADSESPAQDIELLRFDRIERGFHWSNAAFFLVLAATGAIMFFPALSILVGRRDLIRTLHDFVGFAAVIVPLLLIFGSAGSMLVADLREIDRFDTNDRRWLAGGWRHDLFGRPEKAPPQGKFNAGQKLNAIFTSAAIVVLFGTGMIMLFHRTFPLWLKQGAVLVHDLTALVLTVIVVFHIGIALRDRISMRGMVKGRVTDSWARAHHANWRGEPATSQRRGNRN